MITKDSPHGGKFCSFLFPLVLLAAVLPLSCTDFFSSSWASWAARDKDRLIPRVTTGNVDELIFTTQNDPSLSLALLKKIGTAASGTQSGDNKLKLQSAALEAAVNAAGIGQAVLNADGVLDNIDKDNVQSVITDALNGMGNLEAAGLALAGILPAISDPTFPAFTAASSVEDLAMAAALLLASEAKKTTDPGDYLSNSGNFTGAPAELALEMARAAANRSSEISGSFLDVLEGLNLI